MQIIFIRRLNQGYQLWVDCVSLWRLCLEWLISCANSKLHSILFPLFLALFVLELF